MKQSFIDNISETLHAMRRATPRLGVPRVSQSLGRYYELFRAVSDEGFFLYRICFIHIAITALLQYNNLNVLASFTDDNNNVDAIWEFGCRQN